MDLLDVPAFARMLRMTPQSLYARRSRDPESLPRAIRIGRRLVWRRETIDQWLLDLESSQNRSSRHQTSR